jgi:hypothetical protein
MQKLDIDYSKAPNTLEELNKVVAHHFPHVYLVPDVNVFHLRSEDPATKAKIEATEFSNNLYTGKLGGGVHHYSYQEWVDFIQAIFDGNLIAVQAYPANPDQK